MTEKRRHPRAVPAGRVAVVDALTGQDLGALGNLSATGLMLIAPAPIGEGLLFQVRFSVGTGEKRREISAGIESLWCSPANQADRFWAGFEIVEIADDDQAFLLQVTGE